MNTELEKPHATCRNSASSRSLAALIGAGLLVPVALVAALYKRDMKRAYHRLRGHSTVIPSPCGDIEYAEGGSGIPVLVIHGSGGGFDQGQLIAENFLNSGFRWIAPSRFGYLRSTFHEGATFEDQAHAYAALLDHLGVQRAAVVALSHGGPSALLFAALHPQRVSSLTLISAGVTPLSDAEQVDANQKGNALTTIYKHDWLYWALSTLFRKRFVTLLGADPSLLYELEPDQRQLVTRVIDEMNPVSLRTAGVGFDNRAMLPGARIAAIQAPTLIFHATDDGLQLFHHAQFAASTIPDARLRQFERGGHLLMAVELPTIRAMLQEHIMNHSR